MGGFLPGVKQIANVAALPGIVGRSVGLPDVHSGYGFAIGNMAAFDMEVRCSTLPVKSFIVLRKLFTLAEPRGRGVAGRRGFRHQLRGAAAADQPDGEGRGARQGEARPVPV